MSLLKVTCLSTLRRRIVACNRLCEVARAVARWQGCRSGHIFIAVVGNARMAALHHRYMGLPEPTDVLTFDLGSDRKSRRMEGQIVVCADVARRRAARLQFAAESGGPRARNRALLCELALYVVHGVLHLAGYDDHSKGDFERMHRREDFLLKRLGYGPVWSAGQ